MHLHHLSSNKIIIHHRTTRCDHQNNAAMYRHLSPFEPNLYMDVQSHQGSSDISLLVKMPNPHKHFISRCDHRNIHAHRADINKLNVVAHDFTPIHLFFPSSYHSLFLTNLKPLVSIMVDSPLVSDPCTHIIDGL
ncbi:predicted protein [Lichtheimia corymbifera JMRC:FSU:9682]|uniref:Uncharacterized protein n=1 Tax=Lichtheimia corymbifera JMRC:FSU:9682 TaxID=1263082 RepID=A0A068SEG2_9FUNG|nr:predicted protein [Lichtheimia corymbifera JMRC:FSU:9682]